MKFTLPKWYDLHTHVRQDELLAPIIASQIAMGCAGILAMPNTKPPVAKVFEEDALACRSIVSYAQAINDAGGADFQDVIIPLYLTQDTNANMIAKGAAKGVLRAAKYYPPHGTTGADFGYPFENFMDNGVFAALQDHGVTLCIHGEQHAMAGEAYFTATSNAEDVFYREQMPRLIARFPKMRVACEHVTTKTAADFVQEAGANVAASITPQHLLYTIGDLLQGLKYHLYCLPLLKFAQDREALRHAVMRADNTKFYAGTDSAAHTIKATPCGCAAGCFTGGIAPQLYAQAFEEAGADMADAKTQEIFKNFLCYNGSNFYSLADAKGTFTLEKTPQIIAPLHTEIGDITPLPLGLGHTKIPWTLTL